MTPIISLGELKRLIDTEGKYVLIDVRDRAEMVHGKLPTAHNIPLVELPNALDMAPEEFMRKYSFNRFYRNDLVIFYCRTGNRSAKATQYAISKGYNAKNFFGGIWEWSEIDPNVKKYGPEP